MRSLRWVVGALVLSVAIGGLFLVARTWLSDAAITAIDQAGILLGYLLACLTIALAAVSWLRRAEVVRFMDRFFRRSYTGVGEPVALQPFRDRSLAMVIPVSLREQPEWLLRHFAPEYVSLLYTERSQSIALALARDFGERIRFFPDADQIERGEYCLRDPDDPQETRGRTRFFLRCLEEKGIPARTSALVDTTGGKVPMSIGAFQAAEEHQVSSIYLVGMVPHPKTGVPIVADPTREDHGRPIFLSDHSGPART
jgi:hypothetical protein